ncbi:MAG: HIT family protein [Candidatus Micrarchaeota archaeon]
MTKQKTCVFCKYKDEEAIIYHDNICYAVISQSPINKYHVLVIPKKHYENFIDLPDTLASHLFIVTKNISKAVRKACNPVAITHLSDDDISKEGYNLVAHYKIYIIPSFKDDKVKIEWNRDPDPGIEIRSKFAKEIKNKIEA